MLQSGIPACSLQDRPTKHKHKAHHQGAIRTRPTNQGLKQPSPWPRLQGEDLCTILQYPPNAGHHPKPFLRFKFGPASKRYSGK